MQLTPGVTIVQGPDGDEISINGQKGISNNISVDGADFNNPFFGEQRGGQRPAFTFNQDAIQEMVVVADGAAAEFGRSGAGFVNVVTKSGTNTPAGSAHFFFKEDSLSWENSDGEKFPFDQQQFGATFGGPLRRDQVFFLLAYDQQGFDQTEAARPRPDRAARRRPVRPLGSAEENGPIDRTNDARVFLGKLDYQANASNLFTLRYNYTWSEQQNGTFDVDSWGRSANGVERGFSNAVSGSLLSTLSSSMLNEFRFQLAREDRPRPYAGPDITGQSRPFPDTAFDFGSSYRFGEPFFFPVEYNDTRVQVTNNFSLILGTHTIKVGGEFNRVNSSQTFIGFANGRYVFGSTQGFLNYVAVRAALRRVLERHHAARPAPARRAASITGPLLLFLQQAGVGGLSVEEAGTQDIPQIEPSFFIQDKWQPDRQPHDQLRAAVGSAAPARPDHAAERGVLRAVHRPARVPVRWHHPVGQEDVPAPSGHLVGSGRQRPAGLAVQHRPVLRAHSRAEPGQLALDQRQPRPDAVPRQHLQRVRRDPADLAQPDSAVGDRQPRSPRRVRVRQGLPQSADVVVHRGLRARADGQSVGVASPTRTRTPTSSPGSSTATTRCSGRRGAPDSAPTAPTGSPRLTVVESSAKSRYDGVTFGLNKKYAQNYQFQVNYTLSRDMSDDDNERDPFTFRYARADTLEPEYNYSDRDQRHRFNALVPDDLQRGFEFTSRISGRTAQPKSIGNTPQDRIQPDGSIVKRNTLRKDNEFFTWDLRLSKDFTVGRTSIQPIVEVFNLTNSKNIKRPEVTNLVFNFDGTVQSGLGDPRQLQVGVRVRF